MQGYPTASIFLPVAENRVQDFISLSHKRRFFSSSFREFAPINSTVRLSARVRSKESRVRIPARAAGLP